MSRKLITSPGRRVLWALAVTLICIVAALALQSEPVHAATATTDDGFTITKTGYGSSLKVYVSGYSGNETELTLPTSATFSGTEYTLTTVESFLTASQKASVTSITIPEGPTSIGLSAFKGYTGLETVNVPSSVTSISSSAFEGCTALKNITIADGSKSLNINNYAFKDCTALESITLPSRINTDTEGRNWFIGCTSLEKIEVTGNDDYVTDDNGALYVKNDTGLTLINYPGSKITSTFTVPDSVGDQKVTALGIMCFRNNTTLETLTVPASITTFNSYCINGCSNLKTLILQGAELNFGESYYAFQDMAAGSVIRVASEDLKTTLESATNQYTAANTTIEVIQLADPYDLNGDGTADLLDMTLMQQSYKMSSIDENWDSISAADLNADGIIDIEDLVKMYNHIYK